MTTLRSLLVAVWTYGSLALLSIVCSPLLLMPHRAAMTVVKAWGHTVLFGLQVLGGVRVEIRGLHHRPAGAALIAAKHQGMLDIIAPLTFLDDPCLVMKKELKPVPFLGWFAWKTKMIAVDRAAHAKALKDMLRQARARLAEGRQVLIFPEGTRIAPGVAGDYKPGVAAIYRDLDAPCWPVATNSGVHWPAHGFRRTPGLVVFEFLEPIPAGLKRAEFMQTLEQRIETASLALLAEDPAWPHA